MTQTESQRVILGADSFRESYNTKLAGIESMDMDYIDDAIGYLDDMAPVLTPLLEADPNSKMGGDVARHFDGLRE